MRFAWRRRLCLALGILAHGPTGAARADIVTDGSTGARADLAGPDFQIGADLGTRAGRNLFHSFERFDLDAGERATFSGPDAIRNVISRVTGGARSDIDGTLASTIPGAALFFLNPAGVMFGPNARLDLQGSFHVSTADELRFADGARFSATNPTASSFTVAAPEAFGFLGTHDPAPILVDRSTLAVPTREALSLVGGDIDVTGGVLTAPAARLNLLALDEGEARLTDGMLIGSLADIVIIGSRIESETQGMAGTIRISGDRIRIIRQAVVSAGVDFVGGGEAGSIIINASDLVVDDALLAASTPDLDRGGRIRLRGNRIRIMNGALVRVGGGGLAESAASIAIDASDFTLEDASLRASNGFTAGRIRISADRIQILERAQVSTAAANSGGSILIDASDLLVNEASIDASASIGAPGFGASTISIRADRIRIMNGATVIALTVLDGDEEVPASITIDTSNLIVDHASIAAGSTGVGRGGGIRISAGRIELRHGTIESNSGSPSGPGTPDSPDPLGATPPPPPPPPPPSPPCCGDAGDIVLVVRDALIMDGGTISTSAESSNVAQTPGGGGRITLIVGQLLDVRDSTIASNVNGGLETTAGDITIDPRFVVLDGSRILAQANEGRGGNIQITAEYLLLSDSMISASAGPAGIDGTVAISAPEVDLSGGLVVPEGAIVDTAQLRERCASRRDIGTSSFTPVDRGGLPPGPDGALSSAHDFGSRAVAPELASVPAGSIRLTENRAPVLAPAFACGGRD